MNAPEAKSSLPPGRHAGVSLHVTSLPGPFGIGDIGDASRQFLDTLREMKLSFWQFLPTGPTAYGDSPYQPLSAFAGNENLIGLEPLVRAGLLRAEEPEALRPLPRDRVDFGRLIPAKTALLRQAAERFAGGTAGWLRQGFEEFLERHDRNWLDDYALYRILKTRHGERAWPAWERAFVRRDAEALRGLRAEARAPMERIKFLQYLFDRQWRSLQELASERRVRLFADMPIYIALDSADAWAHPERLQIDRDGRPSRVAGVPPDYFSADGQLWGNPLYDWDQHAATGFAWWIERMRHAASMADLVRIDHFRGFESYWAVPMGADSARRGRWEPGPRDALFDALQGALGALPIVAEDLGVITPQVDALRHRYGIPGMVVLQFAVDDPEFRPAAIEENSVCYTGTHDNDTTLGWFKGGGDDTRTAEQVAASRKAVLRLTGGCPATIHHDLVRLAFDSPARLAIAPMQDYLGLDSAARLNVPGTTRDNWRWRLRSAQLTPDLLRRVSEMVSQAGRG